ncbi:MAG: transposase [Verrucomicrobia bacterium]|nr:transposase [Verrucomicrobiota bacterium]
MPDADHPDLTNLLERVASLEEELGRTRDKLALANAEIKRKDQIIAGLQHLLFGSSSEKLDPNRLELLFNELIMGKPAPADAAGPEQAKTKTRAASTRRTKEDRFPKNLKIIVEQVIIPDVVAADPDKYDEISEEYHDELDVIKPQMCWRRKILKKFALKSDKSRPPLIAPAPLPSVPGTLIAPALAAQIAVDRFVDHFPYYRQSNRFDRLYGVDVGRQTLNTWIHATARHLTPIGAAIRGEVRQAIELIIDETPHDYLCPGHGKTKRGYLWVLHDPAGRNSWFEWHAGRGHECLLDFLGYDPETKTISFNGTILCDGYSAYRAFAALFGNILLAGCLAHIRRKFEEAMPEKPELILPDPAGDPTNLFHREATPRGQGASGLSRVGPALPQPSRRRATPSAYRRGKNGKSASRQTWRGSHLRHQPVGQVPCLPGPRNSRGGHQSCREPDSSNQVRCEKLHVLR